MGLRSMLGRFFTWFKVTARNEPEVLYILGFQGLLIASAILLALNMKGTADNLAVIAYFMLLGGVLSQLATYIWRSRNEEDS